MRNVLYTLTIFIIIAWVIGILKFNLSGLINVLFSIALISVLLGLISGARKN